MALHIFHKFLLHHRIMLNWRETNSFLEAKSSMILVVLQISHLFCLISQTCSLFSVHWSLCLSYWLPKRIFVCLFSNLSITLAVMDSLSLLINDILNIESISYELQYPRPQRQKISENDISNVVLILDGSSEHDAPARTKICLFGQNKPILTLSNLMP